MWILENSKELIEHLKSANFNLIKTSSTLIVQPFTQPPTSRLATIIQNSFVHKNGNRRYKYLVLGREEPYIMKEYNDSNSKHAKEDIEMLEFLFGTISWSPRERYSNR